MKSKDYRKEGRKLKERRAKLDIDEMDSVTGGGAPSSTCFEDAVYQIKYGKNRIATITLLDGTNKTATYNGKTHEWDKGAIHIPDYMKKNVEKYYR